LRNGQILGLRPLKYISALLLVHLNDVVCDVVDVVSSVTILLLGQRGDRVHKVLRLHWSDVRLVHWIRINALLWCLVVVVLTLGSDVEGADIVTG
jgi:hypothetical protein